MQPEYSIRINPLTNNIIFNARISKVPESKINLSVGPRSMRLDTLKHTRAYLLEIKYPKNAKVDEKRAHAFYNGTNLSVRVPVLKYDGIEDDNTQGYRGLVRRVDPLVYSEELAEIDDKKANSSEAGASDSASGDTGDSSTAEECEGDSDNEGSLKAPQKVVSSLRARDRILAKNVPVSNPYVTNIPMKHRPSTKQPELHPTIAYQKKEKYVKDQDELLHIARKAARTEEAKYSARLEKKKQEETALRQHMEAREQRKEMKKSKSRMVVEKAKARLAMGDKKTKSGKRMLQRQSKV